jgi:hypothetical protein
MNAHPVALTLNRKEADRAPALSLMAHGTRDSASNDDTEEALLDFNESDVIAGIVPVPPSIPAAMRDALERMMVLRFAGDSARLDRWLHADHPALRGASPFDTLVAGDGSAVLRALLWNDRETRGRRSGGTSAERQAMLRLVR